MQTIKERWVAYAAIAIGAALLGGALAMMNKGHGLAGDGASSPALVIMLITVAVLGAVISFRNKKAK